jgi:hypothetical protein
LGQLPGCFAGINCTSSLKVESHHALAHDSLLCAWIYLLQVAFKGKNFVSASVDTRYKLKGKKKGKNPNSISG